MMDTFTETTTKSWGSRMKDSIGGVLIGIILFFGSFVLLSWNESRSVKTYNALAEMEKNVISVDAAKVEPANEGKLIHVSGKAVTADILKDKLTNLSKKAISLDRTVEMYQWQEHTQTQTKEKVGGSEETTTTYTYDKDWSDSQVDSSGFKKKEGHMNPKMSYKSASQQAALVKLGGFKLTPGLIGRIGGEEELDITKERAAVFPSEIKRYMKLQDGTAYFSRTGPVNPEEPKVGDYRVSFSFVAPEKDVTIISKQVQKTFEPYMAKNGKQMEILKTGIYSAAAVIEMERQANAMLTWILRAAGFFMMLIGLSLVVNPLRTLLAVLPFLANIFGALSGFVLFLLSLALTFITIAIAWIVVRPVLGILLLAAAAGIFFLMAKAKKKETAPAQ